MRLSRMGFVGVASVLFVSVAPAQETSNQMDAIQRAIRASEYHITWQDQTMLPDLEAAWHATNRAQNLRFYFTADGFRVVDRTADGSPELLQIGIRIPNQNGQETPTFEARDSEFVVDRVGVVESLTNGKSGLEHSLTINRLPDDERPVELELDWTAAGTKITDRSVEFVTGSGRRLSYSIVDVVDATGEKLSARFSTDADRLLLVIDRPEIVWPIIVKNLLTGTANTILEGNVADRIFGSEVAVGDVNGDGFADVAVAVRWWDNGQDDEGAVIVFHGGPGGIASNGSGPIGPAANTVIESNDAHYGWPDSLAIVGDLNGDGYDDLAAGDTDWDPVNPPMGGQQWGAVWVFHGSSSGIAATGLGDGDARIESTVQGAQLGYSIDAAGDVNADGFSDLIAGARWWSDQPSTQDFEGAAFVFHGSSGGLGTTAITGADATIEGNSSYLRAGQGVAGVGDVNGDGYDDVAVIPYTFSNSEVDEGGFTIFHGGVDGVGDSLVDPLIDAADTLIETNIAQVGFVKVAGAGDVNGDGFADVVIGLKSWGDSPAHDDEGLAIVLHGGPTGIASNQTDSLTDHANTVIEGNPNPHTSLHLGQTVAGVGDINGDGYGDIVGGAHAYENGETAEGALFVFHGGPDGVSSSRVDPVEVVADQVLEGDLAYMYFGDDRVVGGDVNGDGYSDIVAGASRYSSSELWEGAVLIYHGGADVSRIESDGQYLAQQSGEGLGESCNSAGDLNGDGYVDFVAGAPWFDSGGHIVGRIDVFYGSAGPFLSIPDWTIIGEPSGDWLGWSQASAGDVNGDGYGDLAVGLPALSNGQPADGQVNVYYGSSSGLSSEADWSFESTDSEAQLGERVAAAGDVNGDGFGDLIVGAPGYANGQTAEGRIYLFLGSSEGLSDVSDWTFESDFVNAMLGAAVAGVGDVNGDQFADVIAGAPGYGNGNFEEGAAYGFLGSATGLPVGPNWFIQSNRDYSNYGFSTAGIGDVNGDGFDDVAVGVPDDSNPEISEGRVYVYHGSPTGSSTVADRVLERNQASSSFGWSVAGAGDINGDGFADLIVGAPDYPSGGLSLGRAELFLGSSTGVAAQPVWSVVGTAGPEAVGRTVAGGDHNGDGFSDIAIGIPFSNAGFLNSGEVELYLGNAGAGRPVLARQFRGADDPGPVQPWGLSHSGDSFQVSMNATSPRGRELVKLHVEACPPGEVWGDVDCRHAVSDAWTEIPLGEEGAVLTETISSLTDGALYRWRAHVLYLPLHADEPGVIEPPVPRHGPWRRLFAMAPAADIRVGTPQAITVELVGVSSAVDEGAPLAEIGLVMTTSDGEASAVDSSVDFDTFNGSAIAGQDYVHTSFNRFFPTGTPSGTVQSIEVNLINDDLDEPEEDFAVELYNPVGAVVGAQNTHTITIADNDPPPEVSAATLVVDEGAGAATVTLELSAPTSFEVTVNYSTDDGTATAPEDYLAASGTATIFPMDNTATIELLIEDDWLEEGDEVFVVELSGAANATLNTPTVEVIIHDDDSGIIFADGFESGDTTMWSKTVP